MTKRKLIITLVLFLLFEVAVWFGAKFLAAEQNFWLVVFVLTALGVTVLVVYLLISRLTARAAPAPQQQANGAAQPSASVAAPKPGADPDLDAITALVNEANNRLAQSPTLASRRIKANVFGLPLYLIGGVEGAGKTTTFLKAGLDAELLAGQVFRDTTVLPTRLANFWYANDSLFVEPSGGFFSQDAGRWVGLLQRIQGKKSGFLKWLMPGKNKQPQLRGFVLFCDLAPFLGVPDPTRIGNLSRRVQERLRMVGESFGTNFPVYVVFTKSDAAPYFNEYFARLTETEDQQILGCTVPGIAPSQRPAGEVFAEAESARLSESFNGLYYSLADKRLTFLPRETSADKKPAVYEYPRELKRVRDTLVQFLVDVFRPNPLQPGPILRGFYFTGTRNVTVSTLSASVASSDQPARASAGEATSLFNLADYQKKMGLVAEAAAPSSNETTVSRWCFVSDLFTRVILPDPLGVKVGFANRQQDMYRRVFFGILTGLAVIFLFLFVRSWWGNTALLNDVETASQAKFEYSPNARAVPSIDALRSMEGLRQQLETLLKYERDGAPWRLRWGLYSGNRVLPSLYDLYFQRFRQVFYEDIHGSMVAGLSRLPSGPDPANPYNATYDRLKAYRMITQCQCKPNKAFLAPVLADVWTTGRSIDPERQVLAGQQLQFYAEELTHKNPYENKVKERAEVTDRGRQYLSSYGGVERIYRGIVEEANKSRQAARLAELAPNYKESLSSPGEVQAAFTRDGWAFAEKAIKDPNQAALGEPCVLGTTGAVKQLMAGAQVEADLTNLYVADYIRRWKEFITSTSVTSFRGIPDAAKKLQMLADNRSPLLAAVFMVSDNTNFPASAAPAASLAQKAVAGAASSGVLSRVAPGASRAAANAKQVADALPAPAVMATPADITRVFQPAREVVSPTNRDRLIDEPNRQYMNALADLQRSMERLDTTNPDISLHEQARRAYDSGMDAVRQISQKFNISGAEGMDNEFKRLLESPLKEASRFIITDPSKANRDKASGAARQFCGKFGALERKFPFNPQSDTDATAEEVAAIFAPGSGAFAQMTTQLGKSLVKQGKVWALAPDAEAKLTPDFVRFVNRLSSIQEALFGDGQQMRMRYSLKPVLNANIQSVSLNIDGVTSTATGAQSQAKQFTWPGAAGSQIVDVRVRSGAAIPFASYQGVWGLFRLMQDADPRPAGSKTIEVSKVRQGRGTPQQVMDQNDKPIVLRLEITEFPNGVDVFDKSFFTVRCPGRIAD